MGKRKGRNRTAPILIVHAPLSGICTKGGTGDDCFTRTS